MSVIPFFMSGLESIFMQLVMHATGKHPQLKIFSSSPWINHISTSPENFQLAGGMKN